MSQVCKCWRCLTAHWSETKIGMGADLIWSSVMFAQWTSRTDWTGESIKPTFTHAGCVTSVQGTQNMAFTKLNSSEKYKPFKQLHKISLRHVLVCVFLPLTRRATAAVQSKRRRCECVTGDRSTRVNVAELSPPCAASVFATGCPPGVTSSGLCEWQPCHKTWLAGRVLVQPLMANGKASIALKECDWLERKKWLVCAHEGRVCCEALLTLGKCLEICVWVCWMHDAALVRAAQVGFGVFLGRQML